MDPSDLGSGVKSVEYFIGAATLSDADVVAQGTKVVKGADYAETNDNTTQTVVALVTDYMGQVSRVRLSGILLQTAPPAPVNIFTNINPLTTLGIDKTDPAGALAASSTEQGDIINGGAAFAFLYSGTDNKAGFATFPMVRNIITNFGENGPSAECYAGSFDGVSVWPILMQMNGSNHISLDRAACCIVPKLLTAQSLDA